MNNDTRSILRTALRAGAESTGDTTADVIEAALDAAEPLIRAVDDEWEPAKVKAGREGTNISEVVRAWLRWYVDNGSPHGIIAIPRSQYDRLIAEDDGPPAALRKLVEESRAQGVGEVNHEQR